MLAIMLCASGLVLGGCFSYKCVTLPAVTVLFATNDAPSSVHVTINVTSNTIITEGAEGKLSYK